MLNVINYTPPYDEIDKYICFHDESAYWKYALVGKYKSYTYYIANCTCKDELVIWADLHGITIDKFVNDHHPQHIC